MIPGTLSPAEAIAASLCWLNSLPKPRVIGDRAAGQVQGYWHATSCRWCKVERAELMRLVQASWADPDFEAAVRVFDRHGRSEKIRSVREAQERAWYDESPVAADDGMTPPSGVLG